MDAMVILIYAHLLVLTAPALMMTISLVEDFKEENRRDERRIAELKLARVSKLAAYRPERIQRAA